MPAPATPNSETSTSAAPLFVREFIGWDVPILTQTTDLLFERYAVDGRWDMRDRVVVLPGSLARRRLAELMALKAEATQSTLYPPQVVTVGALPEQLYLAKFPFASDIVQHLAWLKVLQATPSKELAEILPVPPAKSLTVQWLELSKVLASMHRELASDRLNFRKVADALGGHPEQTRWLALAEIQGRYLAHLDSLELWDIQTARLCALDYDEATTQKQILVVGCVDLNHTQRSFLTAVGQNVEVWIGAPEERQHLFDSHGCLDSSAWENLELELPEGSLLVGNSPGDQAELSAACLANLEARYHAREITLGVPDRSLVPELRHQLDLAGVATRYGAGGVLSQSEPALLLKLIGQFQDSRSFSAFAALLRHPAVDNLLRVMKLDLPRDWLAQVDDYYQAVLPKRIDGFVNQEASGSKVFSTVSKAIERWLARLSSRTRPIGSFVQPLLVILSTAYGKQLCDLKDPAESALALAASYTAGEILALRDVPEELQPGVTVSELIDWLLSNMKGKLVPEATNVRAVEMLGWLELALDDAPALVISGMHDGVVPESVNSDAFLPNNLRRQLGMIDNDRRYARDMYAMQVMLHARQELKIVVGKTDATGDPLTPSRLLMACGLERLPARVLHLVQESSVDCLPVVAKRWKPRSGGSQLAIPKPEGFEPLSQVSVTAFRDYLNCPYRFYLRHVKRLRGDDDGSAELDAPQFGVLLHESLARLQGDMGSVADAEQVERFLIDNLHRLAEGMYGTNPAAAVLIQIEQAEMRLSAFAREQAKRAAEGWEIRFVEDGVSRKDQVRVGTENQLYLIGRIDRIDFHPASGRWAIWDYKTSETAKNPVAVHWSRQRGWRDLQLPLYRSIAKQLGVGEMPTLGYITVPKQAADTGFHVARFDQGQLAEADQVANQIADRISAGDFWPDRIESVDFDDFGRICQADVQRVTVSPPRRRLNQTDESETQVNSAVAARAARLLSGSGSQTQTQLVLPPLLIRASAGTGKTFQLSNRLLQIVLSGQEVDGILATTFTRKAAGEIMHRVLERLATACVDPDSHAEIQQHVQGVDTSAENCLAALRRITASIHRLRISTLDSFFAQVARSFSFEMGLPPGWNAMDPVQEPQYQMKSISRMLDSHERKTLVNLVRMLAKGESGRQVAEEIRRTVGAGYAAYRITDDTAWDQLPLPSAPSESAVESALQTLERTRLNHKSADPQLTKLHLEASIGNWEAVISHGVYTKLHDQTCRYYGRELPGDLVAALEVLAERAAAELLPIRRNQTLASRQVLTAYDQEYTALIRQIRLLAFSDVTHYLAGWMTGQSDDTSLVGQAADASRQRLEFRLDCGVHHLLLDEFQDTAPEQWKILEPLAVPLSGRRSDQSMFCVGDTKQAIYGWRGGVAEVFDSVTNSIPEIEQQELKESFRSSGQVIEAVNEVFQNLGRHRNFSDCDGVAKRWTERFPAHCTARSDLPGYVRLQNGPKVDRDLSVDERRHAFLSFTAQQISELTAVSSAGVGVLLRTNAEVARMIGILRDLGVSASQDGGNPLTDSTAVELVLSLIHLADHPGDEICKFHVLTSPLATQLPGKLDGSVSELAVWFRKEVTRRGLGGTVEKVADMLAPQLSWWDQHRMAQLIRQAHLFESSFGGRLREFEGVVEFQRVALPSEAQVKVMTIHRSKGLEFDAVFLPDLEVDLVDANTLLVLRGENPCRPPTGVLRYMNSSLQAMLPASWQKAFDQQRSRVATETLCLLYVAMTRAKRALIMTARPTGSPPSQQFGSLLQSTLGAKELTKVPESTLFEDGDQDWYRQLPKRDERPLEKASDVEAADGLAIRIRTDDQTAPVRGLRVVAPSSSNQMLEPVPLASKFSVSQSIGAAYGTLIHALFEQIQWLEDFKLDRGQLKKVALASVSPEELQLISLDRALDDFEEMLELGSVRSALGKSRYRQPAFGRVADHVQIDNERVVSLIMDQQMISGTIDRLAVLEQDGKPFAAEIIDFKTDAFDPNMTLLWLDDRVQHHKPQLDAYAQVVHRLFRIPMERIATYLVMLSTDDLVRVDRAIPDPHFDSSKSASRCNG